MKMTSAYANKMIKTLEEDKQYWIQKENESNAYTCAPDEEPLIPDYDFKEVCETIDEIDKKVCILKHAINLHNTSARIPVGDKVYSVDTLLIRMAQLNGRKYTFDSFRRAQPKTRLSNRFSSQNAGPEFRYVNYDVKDAEAAYEAVSREIMEMQIALDKFNQTDEFEVEF